MPRIEESFGLVFGLLVVLSALFPFSDELWGRATISLIGAVVFLIVFRSTRLYNRHRRVSIVASLVILILALAAAGTTDVSSEQSVVLGAYSVVVASVLTISILVIARRVFERKVVTVDTILGAVSIYLLLGLAFGYAYIAVDDFTDGGLFAEGHVAQQGEHLYFSFVTLTTLGYGDLAPVAAAGRSLATVEAVLGQVVLVTLVAWLVARFRRSGEQTPSECRPQQDPSPPA